MDLLGQEIFRLLKLSREHSSGDELLKEALAGREKNADSVTRLFGFVVKHFGMDKSTVTDKFWKACSAFLEEAGVDEKSLARIRNPNLRPGDPKFRSVLDELYDEGHDVPEEYLSPTTKRRMEKQS